MRLNPVQTKISTQVTFAEKKFSFLKELEHNHEKTEEKQHTVALKAALS